MPPIWDPKDIFALQPDEQSGWQCVGTIASANCGTTERCQRLIPIAEINKAEKLVLEMSNQIPDQVEHNILLHLARACLCVDIPEPHRGTQEAHVIYKWTGMMSQEAEAFRAQQHLGKKADTTPSHLDTFPTPKAFAFLNEEEHKPELEIIAPIPISITTRPPFPSLIFGSSGNILSPSIRMRRCARDNSPTSALTIVPPFTFTPVSGNSLPPSPPDSATSTLPFSSASTGSPVANFNATETLAPLPTSTTIETSCSRIWTPRRAFTESDQSSSTSQQEQLTHASILANSSLMQLEEYNRLLQETHARHVALLKQVTELHQQLSGVRQLQLDLSSGLAQLIPAKTS